MGSLMAEVNACVCVFMGVVLCMCVRVCEGQNSILGVISQVPVHPVD